MTYREFLGRSWALPLVVFNVGSLMFTGLVLLGAGHQVPTTRNAAGHGWSVTGATVVSLASMASILILLGRAIAAIDPATGIAARRDYALKALGKTVRSELRELSSLDLMLRTGAAVRVWQVSGDHSGPSPRLPQSSLISTS